MVGKYYKLRNFYFLFNAVLFLNSFLSELFNPYDKHQENYKKNNEIKHIMMADRINPEYLDPFIYRDVIVTQ